MYKSIAALILSLICSFPLHAQVTETDKYVTNIAGENKDTVCWTNGGSLTLGINQGFLHNWPAGGEVASLTINGLANGWATRQYHRHVWSNNLDMSYALFYANSNDFKPRKIDDRIDFSSRYGYRVDTARDFFLTGLFNFRSQFTEGYDYSVPSYDTFNTSRFFSPAYFTLAAGMEYRRGDALSLFLSPVAARLTVADRYHTLRAPEGAFGVPYGERTRLELGAYFSGRYTVNLSKNITYKARLDLYSNYLAKDKKDDNGLVVKRDSPANIDILWDNVLSMKVARFFNITLAVTAIYDNDIPYLKTYTDELGNEIPKDEPGTGLGWWQLKQVLTFGFNYKF